MERLELERLELERLELERLELEGLELERLELERLELEQLKQLDRLYLHLCLYLMNLQKDKSLQVLVSLKFLVK